MKKIYLYIILTLVFCNVAFAEKINLKCDLYVNDQHAATKNFELDSLAKDNNENEIFFTNDDISFVELIDGEQGWHKIFYKLNRQNNEFVFEMSQPYDLKDLKDSKKSQLHIGISGEGKCETK